MLDEHLEKGGVWEMPVVASDGSRRHVLWSYAQKGDVDYLFGADITHYVEQLSDLPSQLESLQKRYNELEELDELRTSAIRRTVHDLKTPLIALKGNMQLERAAEDAEAKERWLDAMDTNLDCLIRMVDMLRESVRADANALKPRMEKVELDGLLNRVVQHLGGIALTKGVVLGSKIPEHLSVLGDEDMLWSVFTNIVHNAITHTPSGGRVDVEASREHSRVHVKVKDTGVGMSPS